MARCLILLSPKPIRYMSISRFFIALILAAIALSILLVAYFDAFDTEVSMEPEHLMAQMPLPEKLVPHMETITHDCDLGTIYIELKGKPSQLQLHDELTAKGWSQDEQNPLQYKQGLKTLLLIEDEQGIWIH